MKLTPDEQLGTRIGWLWCDGCQAIREPWHIHGDLLEHFTHVELLQLARVMREAARQSAVPPAAPRRKP